MQIDHVFAEAHQHLRGGLAADAAVDVVLAGERLVELPDVGDGIAEEDHALFAGRWGAEFDVVVVVARQLAVVVHQHARVALAVEFEAAGRGVSILGGGLHRCAVCLLCPCSGTHDDSDQKHCQFFHANKLSLRSAPNRLSLPNQKGSGVSPLPLFPIGYSRSLRHHLQRANLFLAHGQLFHQIDPHLVAAPWCFRNRDLAGL